MSKTYEAMLRDGEFPDHSLPRSSVLTKWDFVDFQDTKEMGDLVQRMAYLKKKHKSNVFNFSSSHHEEGVSTIIVNVAKFLAGQQSAKGILLIDGNVHNPVLHLPFNLPVQPGLTNVMADGSAYSDSIFGAQPNIIDVMPAGGLTDASLNSIKQENLIRLIDAIKNNYSYILIDSPPILTSAYSLPFAVASDITFLVVRSHEIRIDVARKTVLMLKENDRPIGGVIFNRILHVIPQWLYKRL
jgi:Mrp family chromosome partitioning ATPase